MQKKYDQLEEDNKNTNAPSSLTAKNLAMMDVIGAAKPSRSKNLDPIIEEGGSSEKKIYLDENDPKRKKYDELKKKALLVT